MKRGLKRFMCCMVFSILTVILLYSCGGRNESKHNEEKLPIRYLALGDSYTIGEGVASDQRWPVQLVAALRQNDLQVSDPVIVAKTGWTTGELLLAIDTAVLADEYDLVSLLIGVNNQYRGLPIEEFRAEFIRLLAVATNFAGGTSGRVVVLSIPDWGVTPFAVRRDRHKIAGEIDDFNRVVKQESEKLGIAYFDITPLSRRAMEEPKLIAGDNLHPSGEMYTLWVEQILPKVKEMVAASR